MVKKETYGWNRIPAEFLYTLPFKYQKGSVVSFKWRSYAAFDFFIKNITANQKKSQNNKCTIYKIEKKYKGKKR